MMKLAWRIVVCILLVSLPCLGQQRFSTDTGECGGDARMEGTDSKTSIRTSQSGRLRVYGLMEFRHNEEDAKAGHCHVTYRLFVAKGSGKFVEVRSLAWDTEEGEIAGIDLIGFSSDESKLGADFWLAEGDGQVHRPLVYDARTSKVLYRPLDDRIRRKTQSCDQTEHFIGVTNQGEAVFTVPPSTYDDSDSCGDKGVWHFNLLTGDVKRVQRISRDRWR
jgi:hypothetical protein